MGGGGGGVDLRGPPQRRPNDSQPKTSTAGRAGESPSQPGSGVTAAALATPSLRQRVGHWIAGRAATTPIDFDPQFQAFFGSGLGHQPTHATLLQESLGVPDMATRAIANRVSTLNPQIKVTRRIADGTEEDEILDDHPLKLLLDRPHPNLSRSQMLRLAAQYIVTVGESYWLKVGSQLRVPIELHPMPPGQVAPVIRNGVVVAYRVQKGDGGTITLPADVIVRFYFPDPEAIWSSEGYLGPNGTVADSLKFAGQHLRSHYESDATPKTVLEAGEAAIAFKDTEEHHFGQSWRDRYHGRLGKNRGIPGILPLGYKLIQMVMQSGADIVPLLIHWQDNALMGFGTPRSILGQVVSGDRSSAETNQYVFDRHAILPIATLIAESLTLQLAPDFDASIFVEFEEFVSADKEFGLKQETADLVGKVRSVNQVRRDRALDPVEWGEDPVATLGQVPYDPSSGFDLEGDDEDALRGGGRGRPNGRDGAASPNGTRPSRAGTTAAAGYAASLSRAAFFSPRSEWLRQIRREKKFTPAFRIQMELIFFNQRNAVLDALKDSAPERQRVEAIPLTGVTVEDLFDPDDPRWAKMFRLRVDPVREKAFTTILGETLTGLGTPDLFVFTDAMREQLRKEGARLIKRANATTQARIARRLEIAVAEGQGVDQVARSIREVFAVQRKHARTIARTEILKASQSAQLTGFETSEVVESKVWHTALDDAVRDSHAAPGVESQQRQLGTPFTLGDGEMADAPGLGADGAQLSAGNAINCRCFVLPVVEG